MGEILFTIGLNVGLNDACSFALKKFKEVFWEMSYLGVICKI